jgi:hypothetical protein
MELGESFVFYVPRQSANPSAPSTEMLGFASTFLWDVLALSTEVPGPIDEPKVLRDRLSKVFDMWRRVARVDESMTES